MLCSMSMAMFGMVELSSKPLLACAFRVDRANVWNGLTNGTLVVPVCQEATTELHHCAVGGVRTPGPADGIVNQKHNSRDRSAVGCCACGWFEYLYYVCRFRMITSVFSDDKCGDTTCHELEPSASRQPRPKFPERPQS